MNFALKNYSPTVGLEAGRDVGAEEGAGAGGVLPTGAAGLTPVVTALQSVD